MAAVGLYNSESQWLSEFSRDEKGKRVFEIWPENEATLNMFLSLRTQWLSVSNGMETRITGLNYAGVECALRMHEVPNTREMFIDLQLMEGAALTELN